MYVQVGCVKLEHRYATRFPVITAGLATILPTVSSASALWDSLATAVNVKSTSVLLAIVWKTSLPSEKMGQKTLIMLPVSEISVL